MAPRTRRRSEIRKFDQRRLRLERLEDRRLLALDFGFAVAAGGGGYDQGTGMATDAAGNVYVAGQFLSTVDFDPSAAMVELTSFGQEDIFVAKYSPEGALLWARQFGGSGRDSGFDVAVDGAGNAYTTGRFRGNADFNPGAASFNLTSVGPQDVFVSKLDSNGNFVWAKQLGGNGPDLGVLNDLGTSIGLDGGGNVYTTGLFYVTADFDPGTGTFNLTSAGGQDVFISKLDTSGNFVWARRVGGPDEGGVEGIAVDASGSAYISGGFQGTSDFDPGPGTFHLSSAGIQDAYICKLDNGGNFVYARRMGGAANDIGERVAVDAAGNAYTTGSFRGTADFDPGPGVFNLMSAGAEDAFVAKLDSGGNLVWARRLGGSSGDIGRDVAVDGIGNVYSMGPFAGTADFDPGAGDLHLTSGSSSDVFISKLDSGGNFVAARQLGNNGSGTVDGWGIVVHSSGHVYTTGSFTGTTDFDPGAGIVNRTSTASADIFVSKLTQVPPNAAPDADAGGPHAATEGDTVQLNASASTDDGVLVDPDAFAWDLDYDGMTFHVDATGMLPTVGPFGDNFAARTIAVRVTDAGGLFDIATTTLEVANAPPAVTAAADLGATEGTLLTLTLAGFTDPGTLDTHEATVDWGDGAVESATVSEANGAGAVSESHTYAAPGIYTVTVTVSDGTGSASDTLLVTVFGDRVQVLLDFSGQSLDEATLTGVHWSPTEATALSFSALFIGGPADWRDFSGNGAVDAEDAELARDLIVARVTQDFSPYNVDVRTLDNSLAVLATQRSGYNDSIVFVTGGTFLDAFPDGYTPPPPCSPQPVETSLYGLAGGACDEVNNGVNGHDDIAFGFAQTIATYVASQFLAIADLRALFVNVVAQTVSHEAGHTFGLAHVFQDLGEPVTHEMMLGVPGNDRRDFEHDFVFQNDSYTIIEGGSRTGQPQDSHDHLTQILEPSTRPWAAVLVPGTLTVMGNDARNNLGVVQTGVGIWTIDVDDRHLNLNPDIDPSVEDFASINPFDAPIAIIRMDGRGEDDTLFVDEFIVVSLWASGGGGDDTIRGGGGNDQLHGDAGRDLLFGMLGNDDLFGGSEDDQLFGGAGKDLLRGNAGADQLWGEDGNDDLRGGSEVDQLFGGAGNDNLDGEAGADQLFGGDGNDKLFGGEDFDIDLLTGGAGNDTFEVYDEDLILDLMAHDKVKRRRR